MRDTDSRVTRCPVWILVVVVVGCGGNTDRKPVNPSPPARGDCNLMNVIDERYFDEMMAQNRATKPAIVADRTNEGLRKGLSKIQVNDVKACQATGWSAKTIKCLEDAGIDDKARQACDSTMTPAQIERNKRDAMALFAEMTYVPEGADQPPQIPALPADSPDDCTVIATVEGRQLIEQVKKALPPDAQPFLKKTMWDSIRKVLPALQEIMTKHCTDDRWRPEMVRCLKAAHDRASHDACLQMLTEQQRESLRRDAQAVMQAMSSQQ